jgi:acyl-CoA dehydrogenase
MAANVRIDDVHVPLGEYFPAIRESVRRICASFPGANWREREEREAYPDEFVKALTEAGYLAALIPEEYGGVAVTSGGNF